MAGTARALLCLAAPGCACPAVPRWILPPGEHCGHILTISPSRVLSHAPQVGPRFPPALPSRSRASPASPASRGWGKRASGYSLSCWSTQFPGEPRRELAARGAPRAMLGPSVLCADPPAGLCFVVLDNTEKQRPKIHPQISPRQPRPSPRDFAQRWENRGGQGGDSEP